jgi:hypothetical protein
LRVHLCAVGRLRSGPERDLIADYTQRFDRTGRALSLGPLTEHEVEDKKNAGMAAEAELLVRAVPSGAVLVTLDERGKLLTSPDFATQLARWRDAGLQDVAEPTGLTRRYGRKRIFRFPSARWSGRTCWCASCWPNNSIARRISYPVGRITGRKACRSGARRLTESSQLPFQAHL